jgi:hypothetical protein
MERYPEADLGSPGPLVHTIERIPIAQFGTFLRSSVERQPGQLNLWMVNRILNSQLTKQHREEPADVAPVCGIERARLGDDAADCGTISQKSGRTADMRLSKL